MDTGIGISAHAAFRLRQRAISSRVLELVIEHHDIDLEAGGGCRVLRLSRAAVASSDVAGEARAHIARLGKVAVVISEDTGKVVTVIQDRRGARGRRYRRGVN